MKNLLCFHMFILLNISDFPFEVFLLLDLVFVFAAASSSEALLTLHFSDEVIGHLILLSLFNNSGYIHILVLSRQHCRLNICRYLVELTNTVFVSDEVIGHLTFSLSLH